MFYSAKFMRTNPLKFKERIMKKHYRFIALPPKNNRVEQIIPERPANAQWDIDGRNLVLSWEAGKNNTSYVIYKIRKSKQPDMDDVRSIIAITGDTSLRLELDKSIHPDKYSYVVTGLSLTNQESNGVVFE